MKKIILSLLVIFIILSVNPLGVKANESNNLNVGNRISSTCKGKNVKLSNELQGLMVATEDSLIIEGTDFKIETEFPVNDFVVVADVDDDGINDVLVYLDVDDYFDHLALISGKTGRVIDKWHHSFITYNDNNEKVTKNALIHHLGFKDGIVYYIYNYHLIAYNPDSQSIVFDYQGEDNLWNYTVLDDKILVTNQLGQVIGLDKRGNLLYQSQLIETKMVAVEYYEDRKLPVVLNAFDIIEYNGIIYVTLEDSRVVIINRDNGTIEKELQLDESSDETLDKNLKNNFYDGLSLAPTGIKNYEYMNYSFQPLNDHLMLIMGHFGNPYLDELSENKVVCSLSLIDLNDFEIKKQITIERSHLISSNVAVSDDKFIVPLSFQNNKLKLMTYNFDGDLISQNDIELSGDNLHVAINYINEGYLLQASGNDPVILNLDLKVERGLSNGMISQKIADLSDGTLVAFNQNNQTKMIRKIDNHSNTVLEFVAPDNYSNNGFKAINYHQNQILALVDETSNGQVIASHIMIMDLTNGHISDHKVLVEQGVDENNRRYQTFVTGEKINYLGDLNKDQNPEILVDEYVIDGKSKAFKSYYGHSFEGADLVIEAGDINNDGINDLINFTESQMTVYYSKIDGFDVTYQKSNLVKNYDKKAKNNNYAQSIGDLDHDGFNEIVINDYNENGCQIYQVINSRDLTTKLTLMQDGVFDYGEYFILTNQDYNNDGIDDLLYFNSYCRYDVVSGHDGSIIWSFYSYQSAYDYDEQPVQLEHLVAFPLEDSNQKLLKLSDLNDDGINEWGYLVCNDEDDYSTSLMIVSGDDFSDYDQIKLGKGDYSENTFLAIDETNKVIYQDEHYYQILDYQNKKITAGLNNAIISVKKLADESLLITTNNGLMTFNDQCDFKLIGLSDTYNQGHLSFGYESAKNGTMSVYDQGELIYVATNKKIELDLLHGDHQLVFSYNDGHGKITHYQIDITVNKSNLVKYLLLISLLLIIIGLYLLDFYPRYQLKKKVGREYEKYHHS